MRAHDSHQPRDLFGGAGHVRTGVAQQLIETRGTRRGTEDRIDAAPVQTLDAVADVTGNEEYRERAGRIIYHVVGWTCENDWRITEHFTAD